MHMEVGYSCGDGATMRLCKEGQVGVRTWGCTRIGPGGNGVTGGWQRGKVKRRQLGIIRIESEGRTVAPCT